jgi:lysyl-tRNA synthetase class 2
MSEETVAGQTTDERTLRRAKRQAMLDRGEFPYPSHFEPDAFAADLEAKYADLGDGVDTDDVVTLAGRIRAIRGHGKIMFIVLQDKTGQIQLFCRVNNFDEATWELIKTLDIGDIIGITGTVVRTKRGELSVAPTEVTLLAKSLRPLPEKFHGLSDKETRYRQRYADMIMNEDVLGTFRKRSHMVAAIRRYMDSEGYLEVETPILQYTLGGANARPFTTHHNALDMDFYLRIATELHLKRLIVGGMDRVYEIGRQFRNEGMDLTHNPEFTTIEAYCAYSDVDGMKRLAEGIFQASADAVCGTRQIDYQGTTIDLDGTWPDPSMSELVSKHVGQEVSVDTPVEELRAINDRLGLEWDESWGAGRLIFNIYDEQVEATIVNPTFVCDYPVEVSPLAKRKPSDPRLTDRFELVIAGHEYANAFTELNDPVDQEERFRDQVAAKAAGDEEAMEYDADYVRALEYGMPPTGGIGIGIDRMAMLLTDQPSIRDVLLFPHMRPEGA